MAVFAATPGLRVTRDGVPFTASGYFDSTEVAASRRSTYRVMLHLSCAQLYLLVSSMSPATAAGPARVWNAAAATGGAGTVRASAEGAALRGFASVTVRGCLGLRLSDAPEFMPGGPTPRTFVRVVGRTDGGSGHLLFHGGGGTAWSPGAPLREVRDGDVLAAVGDIPVVTTAQADDALRALVSARWEEVRGNLQGSFGLSVTFARGR
jgi:hypothetical protein